MEATTTTAADHVCTTVGQPDFGQPCEICEAQMADQAEADYYATPEGAIELFRWRVERRDTEVDQAMAATHLGIPF